MGPRLNCSAHGRKFSLAQMAAERLLAEAQAAAITAQKQVIEMLQAKVAEQDTTIDTVVADRDKWKQRYTSLRGQANADDGAAAMPQSRKRPASEAAPPAKKPPPAGDPKPKTCKRCKEQFVGFKCPKIDCQHAAAKARAEKNRDNVARMLAGGD
jgi:hypothetical protein